MTRATDDLRKELIRAPTNAVFVSHYEPRHLIGIVNLIPRRDLTFVGVSILAEDALVEIDRPVVVANGVALSESQRKALQYHQRRRM